MWIRACDIALLCVLWIPVVRSEDCQSIQSDLLEYFKGKTYAAVDEAYPDVHYVVGICVDLQYQLKERTDEHPGAVKIRTDWDVLESTISLGQINNTEFMSGNGWARLIYHGGQNYHHHCGTEGRRTVLIFLCDPNHPQGHLKLVKEEKNRNSQCYYHFELYHSMVCGDQVLEGCGNVGTIASPKAVLYLMGIIWINVNPWF